MSDFSTARQKMVDGQVRPSDVTDLRILDAMLAVPREMFVLPGQQPIAYLDNDIDVGGDAGKRCLLKPVVLAKMLQAAAVSETDRVLVVGCATGYSAAVISRLAGQVFATEPDKTLAGAAKANLAAANVTVSIANPIDGDQAHGPYDVIVLDGATEIAPQALCEQLKVGGRLVGVSAESRPSRAVMVTRSPGDYGNRVLFDASASILPGLGRVPVFSF